MIACLSLVLLGGVLGGLVTGAAVVGYRAGFHRGALQARRLLRGRRHHHAQPGPSRSGCLDPQDRLPCICQGCRPVTSTRRDS